MSLESQIPAQDSKLAQFPNYKAEFLVNSELLLNAIYHHQEQLYLDLSDLGASVPRDAFEEFYSAYRIKDLLVSITDDLLRYAEYHHIKENTERGNGDVVYSIAEPVRASFFAKWILKLRPCFADTKLPQEHIYHSSWEANPSALDRESHRVEFCNELLALISASLIMKIPYKGTEQTAGYEDLFHSRELSTLFYSLRYRIVHQDIFTSMFYKVFHYHEEPSVTEP
ncbi:MAG: hypothetical protein ACRBB6_12680 [Neptuniibacter sp.]